jgi:hypothetical protein
MKAKLLKLLRNRGRDAITIYSVTKTNGTISGMSIGFNDDIYKGLFEYGLDEVGHKEKAGRAYIKANFYNVRQRYRKYSRVYKILKTFQP